MTRGLINYLKANPDISHVYLNAQGGWLFDPNRLHPIVKTRQEVLDMEDSLPVESVTKGELETIREEYALLREKCDLLEVENQILSEGKKESEDSADSDRWTKEREAYQEKIKALETQLAAVTPKNKKFNATT